MCCYPTLIKFFSKNSRNLSTVDTCKSCSVKKSLHSLTITILVVKVRQLNVILKEQFVFDETYISQQENCIRRKF